MACKRRAGRVLLFFAGAAAALLLIYLTPFSIPCIFKTITGIPCPGCGVTRAFLLLLQFDILGAITMNIMFLPLILGGGAYLACAVKDFFAKGSVKSDIKRFENFFNRKWMIAPAALLVALSWWYNIARGI